MNRQLAQDPAVEDRIAGRIPMRRMGTPEEMAAAGGVDQPGVEARELDGALGKAEQRRGTTLLHLDVAEALDAQVVGDLDAIGAVLEVNDPVVPERDQVEAEDVGGGGAPKSVSSSAPPDSLAPPPPA